MEEEVKGLSDYLDILKRHKYLVIVPTLVLMVLTVLIVYMLPATYKSEGLILIESQEIPNDLVRSTVTSYADQRIEIIKQRIMTTAKVMALVKKYHLYEDMWKKSSVSVIVDRFRQNIEVKMVEANITDPRSGRARRASIAFRVSFMDRSPQVAQKVANDLVTEFLNANVKTRVKRAAQTKEFLQQEANKFQAKVQRLEKKIADFKEQYSDSLPELLEYNLSMIENLQKELSDNKKQIALLQDQNMTMSLELLNIQPYLQEQQLLKPQAKKISKTEDQLEKVKAEYNRLSAKYSKNHPDVIRLKRQIKSLEAELDQQDSAVDDLTAQLETAEQALNTLKQRYSSSHPDVKAKVKQVAKLRKQLETAKKAAKKAPAKPSAAANIKKTINPIYIQIKSKIDASEREIKRLQQRQLEIKKDLADYQQRVSKTYQVQRAYEDLTRDHDNNLAKYKELRAKQLDAELGQNLETENKGESFTLIEPPLVPTKAEKPNRPKLIALGMIASLGAGVGLALLTEMLFGGVRGYEQISRILGNNPLVVIPVINTVQDLKKKKAIRRRIMILILLLLAGVVAVFHFWVMNLEVLWFKILNKISLL